MSIKYEFHINPPQKGEAITRYHPRMISSGTVDSKGIAESLHAQSTLSTGDVQAVLSMLGKEIVHQLSYNNRVHINGIGYFYLSLETKEIESDHEVRAESIKVKKLVLEADDEMKENLNKITIRRSEEKNHSEAISDEDKGQTFRRKKSF
jgi:predicted histone-like DNA-binding protein